MESKILDICLALETGSGFYGVVVVAMLMNIRLFKIIA